jgi:glutaconyl-CoA/methylmalonyl-CoA decarboxylase subunit gamma
VELIVTIGERSERVRVVEHDDGRLQVQVGERTYEVDRAPLPGAGHHWSLLVEGEQFEVAALPRGEGSWWVSSARGGVLAEVADPLTHLARQGAAARGGRRREQVTAYMPGRVVAVLVSAGDRVETGQGIVVLEAMKMQNEIQAEHDGVVKRVCVAAGEAVEGGDVLCELE